MIPFYLYKTIEDIIKNVIEKVTILLDKEQAGIKIKYKKYFIKYISSD